MKVTLDVAFGRGDRGEFLPVNQPKLAADADFEIGEAQSELQGINRFLKRSKSLGRVEFQFVPPAVEADLEDRPLGLP